MRVTEYAADDDEQVEAGRHVLNAARSVDAPWLPELTRHRRRMDVRHGWDQSPVRHLLAWSDGVPVAAADIDLGEWDNRDLAWVDLIVHPAHRRRGHGSHLLAEVTELVGKASRAKLGGSGWEGPATQQFADRHGFPRVSQEIYRKALPAALPEGFVEQVHAEAASHATDYELLRIDGRTPEELLPAVADMTAAINDAPLDDLDIEDEVFPVQRIRDYETATVDSGHRLLRVLARHRPTGQLAGHTVVAVDAERPELAHQHDTSVTRAHRGHRLGLLLKAEMLRWLEESEPQVISIDTWNAETNRHMIAVNDRLGYRALGRELVFQRRL
jgi:GNAT superfamily N-acetyltransferase